MGEVFVDSVPSVSLHGKATRARSASIQPFEVNQAGSEVAKEDGDLNGALDVGVADIEFIERPRRNAGGSEDFLASPIDCQREV